MLLQSLLLLPLLAITCVLSISSTNESLLRKVGLHLTLGIFYFSLFLWLCFDKEFSRFQFVTQCSWFSFFNLEFCLGIDGISLYFILLTTFLIPMCLLASWKNVTVQVKNYMILFLSLGLSMLILSTAGSPVLIGFFLKFALLVVVWSYKFYLEAVIAFFVTIIEASYYIRVAKIILFEETHASRKDKPSGSYMCTGVLALSFWGVVLSVILFGLIIKVLFVGSWELLTFDELCSLFLFIKKPSLVKINNIRPIFGSLALDIFHVNNKHQYFSSSSKQNLVKKITQESTIESRRGISDLDDPVWSDYPILNTSPAFPLPVSTSSDQSVIPVLQLSDDAFCNELDNHLSVLYMERLYFPCPPGVSQSNAEVMGIFSKHLHHMFTETKVVLGLNNFGPFLANTKLKFCSLEPTKDDIRPLTQQFLSFFKGTWGDGINSYLVASNELIKSTLNLQTISGSVMEFISTRPMGQRFELLTFYQWEKLKQTSFALSELKYTMVVVATSMALLAGHFQGCEDVFLLQHVVDILPTCGNLPFSVPFDTSWPCAGDIPFFDQAANALQDGATSSVGVSETSGSVAPSLERWPWRFPTPSTFGVLERIVTVHSDLLLSLLAQFPKP